MPTKTRQNNKSISRGSRASKRNDLSKDTYTIRLKSKDAADGFFVLATNGQTSRLPNNTYIVGRDHLNLLKKAGINYKEV